MNSKILILYLLLFFLFFNAPLHSKTGETQVISEIIPHTVSPTLTRYNFTVRNTRGTVASNVQLWVSIPVATTSYQRCVSITATHDFTIETDEAGNRMAHFTFEILPPYGRTYVSLTARAAGSPEPQPVPLCDPKAYLRSSELADFDSQAFDSCPSFDEGTPSQRVARIIAWVQRTLTRDQFHERPRSASFALTQGKGDCTEFMYLVIALCRRAGIPARAVSGFVCPRNTVVTPYMYHDWVHWYDGKVWRIADAFARSAPQNYIATRMHTWPETVKGTPLFFRCSGSGITAKMSKPK